MTELIKFLYQKLSTVSSRAYLEQAPQETLFPYVTYKFPTSNEVYLREDFILEINIWDNSSDTTVLENLTAEIDMSLNRAQHYDQDKLQTSIYRVNRNMIPDPDPLIRRRQLRYICKTYL